MRKEARKKYPHLYEKHKEASRICANEYYHKNKESILEKRRGNEEFLAKKRVYFNKWKKENKGLYDDARFKWRITPSGMYSMMKSRAKDGKKTLDITRNEFMDWWDKQEKICSYCGLTVKEINKLPDWYARRSGKQRLSIDRKDSQKGYSIDNIVLACYMCNTIKNNFLTYKEMKVVGEIVLKPKLSKMLNL